MREAPEAVLLYIPLMKDLGMSWSEIKKTPRMELEGIRTAYYEYSLIHSFDGYNEKDVSEMAKNKPEVRSQYTEYLLANRELKRKLGKVEQRKSLKDLF